MNTIVQFPAVINFTMPTHGETCDASVAMRSERLLGGRCTSEVAGSASKAVA